MTKKKTIVLLATSAAAVGLAAVGAWRLTVTPSPGCSALKLPGTDEAICFSAKPVRMFTPAPGVPRPEFTKHGYEKPILLVGEPEFRLRKFADEVERSPRAKHTVVDDDVSAHFPKLDRKRGGRIIDLGAGLGPTLHYFTGLVGPRGRLLLVDVDPRIIDFLEYRVSREDAHHRDRQRVVLVQNRMDDPCLPRRWADLVFMRNVHYWVTRLPDNAGREEHRRFWRSVTDAVAPGGRLVVVENYAFRDGLTLKVLLQQIRALGLRRVALADPGQGNWVAAFQRPTTYSR